MRPFAHDLEADAALAGRLGALAAAIALDAAGPAVRCARKPDGTLVSDADLAVERALLGVLAAERPGDAVTSEELAPHVPPAPRRWLIDPIDGTGEYLAGRPDWGTHVALEIDGRLAVAVLTRPAEGRCWWAVRHRGAYAARLGDPLGAARRLRVSSTASLARARAGGYVEPGSSAAASVAARCEWVEGAGSPLAALLAGTLDAVVDEGGAAWDRAPGALLVPEAGGRFSDGRGGDRLDEPLALYSNGLLHRQLVRAIARDRDAAAAG